MEVALRYVSIKDQQLMMALLEALSGKSLTDENLRDLTSLEWSHYRAEAGEGYWRAISDLSGIHYCVNLRKLSLDGNWISSVRPLAGLTHLEELWMTGNQVMNLKPLSGLHHLTTLCLEMNPRLKNVSALAGLERLEYLNIAHTGVTDLAPLVEMPALNRLAWSPPESWHGVPMTAAALRRAEAVLDKLRSRGVELTRYGSAPAA
jgi:internalin A